MIETVSFGEMVTAKREPREISRVTNDLCLEPGGVFTCAYTCKNSSSSILIYVFH